jgi:hypothetical protein
LYIVTGTDQLLVWPSNPTIVRCRCKRWDGRLARSRNLTRTAETAVPREEMMGEFQITMEWLPGRFAVCRFDPSAATPGWALGAVAQVTRRPEGAR